MANTTKQSVDGAGLGISIRMIDNGDGTFSDSVGGSITPQPSPTVTGLLEAKVISAASTNATSVKASSARVFGYSLANTSAAWRYVKLYNKTTAPVPGTDPVVRVIALPPGASVTMDFGGMGLAFAAGLAYAIVTGPADADILPVLANDVVGSIDYI